MASSVVESRAPSTGSIVDLFRQVRARTMQIVGPLEVEDYVAISGPNEITFSTRASNPGDYVRVLTEFSPKARRITSKQPEPVNPLEILHALLAYLKFSIFI